MLRRHAFAICYRYIDSRELIEDLLNRSFIQLFKHIDQFDKEKYPDINTGVKVWLSRIVVMHCIEYYRQLRLFSHELLLPGEVENLQYPPENADGQPSDQEIIESIRKLPPYFRIVFNLSVIEGMSQEEIGDHLGISAPRSGLVLSAARVMMKKNLSGKTSQPWAGEESPHSFSAPG